MDLDSKALYQAIDAKRHEFQLGWCEIAYYNEISLETLESLNVGECPDEEVCRRLCVWVGKHIEEFAKAPNLVKAVKNPIAKKSLANQILHPRKNKLA